MKKSPKQQNRNFSSTEKSNVDAKVAQASLLLDYSFGYKVDFKNRIITISGDIDKDVFEIIDAGLTEMESQSRKAVTIKINSGGGDTYQAAAIVGRLRESKCKIITKGYGYIMSAATIILACGHERFCSKYAMFMHHESSYGFEGKHSTTKDLVEQLEREDDLWCMWMEEFTAKPKAFWRKTGVRKDAYFTADQLLELGVVDQIF